MTIKCLFLFVCLVLKNLFLFSVSTPMAYIEHLNLSHFHSDSLGWIILLHFLIYITIPVPFQYNGISMGLILFILHIAIVTIESLEDALFERQQLANIVLAIAGVSIGLICSYLNEGKQRRAFLEAKQSLEMKMVIEEQSAEQVSIFI